MNEGICLDFNEDGDAVVSFKESEGKDWNPRCFDPRCDDFGFAEQAGYSQLICKETGTGIGDTCPKGRWFYVRSKA